MKAFRFLSKIERIPLLGFEIMNPGMFSKIEFFSVFSDWENLPKHLLDSVLELLVSPLDYLRFSVSCKSWYSVAKDNESKLAKMTTPMRLISGEEEDTWYLYNVMDDKVLDLRMRLFKKNMRFCGSSKGWLVAVEENFVVTLLNPFSMVKGRENKENSIIRLPPLRPPKRGNEYWAKNCDYYVYRATISADPILNASDCIVFVIYGGYRELAYIRLNKDSTWTHAETMLNAIDDVIHIEDKAYVVDDESNLLSCDLPYESGSFVNLEANGKGDAAKKYLVYSNKKELLMIQRSLLLLGDNNVATTKFIIFQMNFDKCEWIEKETLGDAALFVGDNSAIYVPTSKFSGYQPNCIYFNHDTIRGTSWKFGLNDFGRQNFGVYNVKNRSISKPYAEDAMTLEKMTDRPPIWVVPTFQL